MPTQLSFSHAVGADDNEADDIIVEDVLHRVTKEHHQRAAERMSSLAEEIRTLQHQISSLQLLSAMHEELEVLTPSAVLSAKLAECDVSVRDAQREAVVRLEPMESSPIAVTSSHMNVDTHPTTSLLPLMKKPPPEVSGPVAMRRADPSRREWWIRVSDALRDAETASNRSDGDARDGVHLRALCCTVEEEVPYPDLNRDPFLEAMLHLWSQRTSSM